MPGLAEAPFHDILAEQDGALREHSLSKNRHLTAVTDIAELSAGTIINGAQKERDSIHSADMRGEPIQCGGEAARLPKTAEPHPARSSAP